MKGEAFARRTAMTACRALLYEVSVTPKPGLVDRNNAGAHADMDIFTFIDSAMAITPYFYDLTLLGIENAASSPEAVFDKSRRMGMRAEAAMRAAANGVNTHKGVIFSMGLLSVAAGYRFANRMPHSSDGITRLCAEMSKERLAAELSAVQSPETTGEALFLKHQIQGVRGEAAGGFASVMRHGLPVLKETLEKGFSLNDAGVVTLISLLGHVGDTNLIKRAGVDEAKRIQTWAAQIVSDGLTPERFDALLAMDDSFIKRNISPGGCADLLAVTFMLYFMEVGADFF